MKFSENNKSFFVLIAFAIMTIIIWQVPGGNLILYPFTLLGTWFHEMAHGLTATILGGDFMRLEIFPNGSGLAYHRGPLFLGNIGSAMVAAAGPLGPTFAGISLIVMSTSPRSTRLMLAALGAIMVISAVIWIRPWFGFLFITGFSVIILLIALFGGRGFQRVTLQFLGIQAFVSTYMSIGYLLSSGGNIGGNAYKSDTAVIAENLLLPYWFWGGLIILISVLLIYKSFKYIYHSK